MHKNKYNKHIDIAVTNLTASKLKSCEYWPTYTSNMSKNTRVALREFEFLRFPR